MSSTGPDGSYEEDVVAWAKSIRDFLKGQYESAAARRSVNSPKIYLTQRQVDLFRQQALKDGHTDEWYDQWVTDCVTVVETIEEYDARERYKTHAEQSPNEACLLRRESFRDRIDANLNRRCGLCVMPSEACERCGAVRPRSTT